MELMLPTALTTRLLIFLLSVTVDDAVLGAQSLPLTLNLERRHQLDARTLPGGTVELTTRGEDPYVLLSRFDAGAVGPEQTILEFEYFALAGVDAFSIFYGPPFRGTRHFHAGTLRPTQSFQPITIDLRARSGGRWRPEFNILRLDLGRREGVTVRLRNFRLRSPTDAELKSRADRQAERERKLEREAVVNAWYAADAPFPSSLDSVRVEDDVIRVSGTSTSAMRDEHLIEFRPEVSLAADVRRDGELFSLATDMDVTDHGPIGVAGAFTKSVPRRDAGRDRNTSRWAVAKRTPRGWTLRSRWSYANAWSGTADRVAAPVVPRTRKGMAGVDARFPLDELVELGVSHVTLNMELAGLLDTRRTARHNLPFDFGGRRWFANEARLRTWDRVTTFANKHDIVVTGILLVGFVDSEYGRLLRHPEAEKAGRYAMPNLSDAAGVRAYEAALELLARRYARSESEQGRIANWIVHNEVGFGWEWTNMGTQPPMLFMDHYLRSMRLVHDVMRRHDTHARVFISLTHHWAAPTDPSWKSYCNLDLLNRLVASSKAEGDFAWGVAFHPYPQSLLDAATWNDTRALDDPATPLITPKNLHILDDFMHRSEVRGAAGRVRGVLLSEQGFHTPDDSRSSEELQAAALIYTWNKLELLASIEAFHYHRWVDHPREGGLNLGLRKQAADGSRFGEKKLAWKTFQSLGTESQVAFERLADEVIRRTTRPSPSR